MHTQVIYLVDASVYVFRAYYSLPPDMRDADSNPVHALYGFARFLSDLIEHAKPQYIAVAFDASLSTSFTHQIYRPTRQTASPRRRTSCFCSSSAAGSSAPTSASPGTTVPNSKPTTSRHARGAQRNEGLRSTLVTRDRISRSSSVPAMCTGIRRQHPLSPRADRRGFGVAPDRYADYLALTGDSRRQHSRVCRE